MTSLVHPTFRHTGATINHILSVIKHRSRFQLLSVWFRVNLVIVWFAGHFSLEVFTNSGGTDQREGVLFSVQADTCDIHNVCV